MDSFVYRYLANEHKEEAKEIVEKEGDVGILKVPCLGTCSQKIFFVLKKYKKEVVTCPHCQTKQSVRQFKNGNVTVRLMEETNE